jgi:hypothetical protein
VRRRGFEWQYLALYDGALYDFHYYSLQLQDNGPDTPHEGGVIPEEFDCVEQRERDFKAWYVEHYMREAA